MSENLYRLTRNGNVLWEGHVPAGAKMKTVKGDDGSTTFDLQFDSDDMPGANTANSELEARTPRVHAHAPHDPVNPKPEPEIVKPKDSSKPADQAAEEQAGGGVEAFQAPAEAQKELLKAEGRDPDASDSKNRAAQKRQAAKARTSRKR